jgi:CheY-like chemotaxis protein
MRILIVEDDVFFRTFYSNKLKEQGFVVDVASDGEEGLKKIFAQKPDLVLLDIIMPKFDGFEVLKQVKRYPAYSAIPIIVFSTLGTEGDVKKALQLGANGHANKSLFDFSMLLQKIKEVTQGVATPPAPTSQAK